MREIKFRAWDTYDLCMRPVTRIEQFFDIDQNGFYPTKLAAQMIKKEDLSEVHVLYSFDQKNMPFLMQYIGHKDKNGKEIYEGDIVSEQRWLDTEAEIYEVTFEDFGFFPFYPGSLGCCGASCDLQYSKIIGNICENPELLKT